MTNNSELNTYLTNFFATEAQSFLNAQPENRAIRINTLKTSKTELIDRLNQLKVNFSELSFNPHGLELKNDQIPLSHTLDFFQGYFSYQGMSSQIPVLALDPQPGEKILDIAAAPGSKSTQIAALMQNKGQLFLNDISKNRLQSLNVNIQRAGITNEIILNIAGERIGNLFPEYFDKILIDAPCTALGTIAGNPEVTGWWSIEKLNKLSISQKQLLISAFKALKPGGEMVYSTCSIAPEENELPVQYLLDNYPASIQSLALKETLCCEDGLTYYANQKLNVGISKAIRIYPHKHGMEGFFVVKLKKTDSVLKNENKEKIKWLTTYSFEDIQIKNELVALSELWRIHKSIWNDFRFIMTRSRIWMLSGKIEHIPDERLHNAGLLLSEKRLSGWKLTNQSAQFLNDSIQQRRITLNDDQFIELFAEGSIQISDLAYGYYVLERESKAIASVYWEKGKLRIRLPHAFRLTL